MNNNEINRREVDEIVNDIIDRINPYDKTRECVNNIAFNSGRKMLVSIGKASWIMAKAICDSIQIDDGVVITKYGHSKGDIFGVKIFEAGHPIIDQNSIDATDYSLSITSNLNENDTVIVCLSGGGSSLFEKPLIALNELQNINSQLINSGASISEINIIRKKLSAVKGGKFAKHIYPAKIYAIVLSDVVGDDINIVASGPVFSDNSNESEALEIVNKYNILISDNARKVLSFSSKIIVSNVNYRIIGTVVQLCEYTKKSCEKHGYTAYIIDDNCTSNVVDIVNKFKELLFLNTLHNVAYIIGGESSLKVSSNGRGGRNTHLAVLFSKYIYGLKNVCFFAFASDGTDGPTDAAGGYIDGNSYDSNIIDDYIEKFDSYIYLSLKNGLIKTGPTNCNVNDVYVLLIR